jgi:hypothetical protein
VLTLSGSGITMSFLGDVAFQPTGLCVKNPKSNIMKIFRFLNLINHIFMEFITSLLIYKRYNKP